VSNSLRELQGWRIVRVVHVLGDRRDHFESMKDVWEMFRVIVEERKRREIDPTLQLLQECLDQLKRGGGEEAEMRERIAAMLEFLSTTAALYEEVRRMPPGALRGVARLRGKMRKLVGK
jgi:DNA-binding transcriptional regulator GbsR (MarR family)